MSNYPRMYADNILVLLDHHRAPERVTAGGIIVQAAAELRAVDAALGTVVAVGPGYPGRTGAADRSAHDVCSALKPGMRVLIDSQVAAKDVGERWYDDEKREHRIVRAGDIAAIFEGDEAEA